MNKHNQDLKKKKNSLHIARLFKILLCHSLTRSNVELCFKQAERDIRYPVSSRQKEKKKDTNKKKQQQETYPRFKKTKQKQKTANKSSTQPPSGTEACHC